MDFTDLKQTIISCNACPRLRTYCKKIAIKKRRAYLQETYWGKPISGFGDPHARLMIVGLAPGAHGANRTGRVFTGDRSGQWLYRTLYEVGLANQPHSTQSQDGLQLKNTYISCVVKCAPPQNRPTLQEIHRCSKYLQSELQLLSCSKNKVFIALGQIALLGLWPLITQNQPQPKFKHGTVIAINSTDWLILSYHPSQQNTFTGRLTQPMWDGVFLKAKELLQ